MRQEYLRRKRSLLLFPLVLAGCAGGEEEATRPGGQWESARSPFFTYYFRPGAEGDPQAILAAAERRLELLWEHYGLRTYERAPVTWYRFSDEDDFERYGRGDVCPESSDACAVDQTIYSRDGLFLHELIHAGWPTSAAPPYLLREGLAIHHSCIPEQPALRTLDWRELLYEEGSFDLGARFFSHLFASHEPEEVTSWFRSLTPRSDATTVASTFAQVFGESLDEVWSALLASNNVSACSPALFFCEGSDESESVGESESESESVGESEDASLDSIFNPRGWRQLSPAPSVFSTGGDAFGEVQSCEFGADTSLQVAGSVWNRGNPSEVRFFPGDRPYVVGPFTEVTSEWGTTESLASEEPGECGAATQVDLQTLTSPATGWVFAPDQTVVLELTAVLELTRESEGTLWLDRSDFRHYKNGESPAGWVVELCRGCEEGLLTECSETAGWEVTAEDAGPLWLRVRDEGDGRDFLRTQFTWVGGE